METYGELDKEVRNYVIQHNDWLEKDACDQDIAMALNELGYDSVWEGGYEFFRWWVEYDAVVKLGDKYIMFPQAISTRDMSASDSGWQMYLDCVRFVEPREVTVTIYE